MIFCIYLFVFSLNRLSFIYSIFSELSCFPVLFVGSVISSGKERMKFANCEMRSGFGLSFKRHRDGVYLLVSVDSQFVRISISLATLDQLCSKIGTLSQLKLGNLCCIILETSIELTLTADPAAPEISQLNSILFKM